MTTWSDLQKWDGDKFDHLIDVLVAIRHKASDSGEYVRDIDVSSGWTGAGATAAQNRRKGLANSSAFLLANLGEMIRITGKAQSDVNTVKTLVFEVQSLADHYGFNISTIGKVSDPNPIKRSTGDIIAPYDTDHENKRKDRKNALKQCQEKLEYVIQMAKLADEIYTRDLMIIANGTIIVKENLDYPTPGLDDIPSNKKDPTQVAAWWNAHTNKEKESLIRDNPDLIGNLNGVDGTSRDKANRWRIARDKESLMRKYTPDQLKTNQSYQELSAIERSLAKNNGDTQLLVYEPATGERGHEKARAAISAGNVDTADHVATYVPGMGTSVKDSMEGNVSTVTNLKNTAVRQDPSQKVAVVAWIGYDAPPNPQSSHDYSVMDLNKAKSGGESLARFEEGIRGSRDARVGGRSNVHMSVLAHSYGSTTASYGMASVRRGVVNHFAVFGSPGIKDGAWRMNVPKGHSYALEFKDDVIRKTNALKKFWKTDDGLGWHGKDPTMDPGFKKLNPYGPTTKETGHSGYLADGGEAQIKIAKVVLGTAG